LRNTFQSWPGDHFINFDKDAFEDYYPSKFSSKAQAIRQLTKEKKREAKKALLIEVMEWAIRNRQEAITQFDQTAKAVISILKSIEKKMSNESRYSTG